MRPAGKGPLDSLYFTYPRFHARHVAELDGDAAMHPVVIAGAGPVGMTAALTLARYGVPCVLLDRKSTFNDGSRAICMARASMHIFERVGAVAPFLAKSLGWRHGRSYYGTSEVFRLEMPHTPDDKYLPMYNLQQQYIEHYLHDAVAAAPLIDMRWESEVIAVDTHPSDHVTLQVASPAGTYALRARHVLAADGARSPIRGMLGLRLAGENYEGRYVIADVKMTHDFPTERRAFFAPPGNPDGTVLVHRQPDDIWRIDYQLRVSEDEAEAIREDNIRTRVAAILADIGHAGPWDLEWWSVYSANTLCLDDYRHGRVTFIGDSAHIVPIFGVRGLNNGLADAHNIGWKLAYVLQGHAPWALLDSYTAERRGATLDVFANATKSTRFMTPPTRGWTLARDAALSLALRHDFTRNLANPRQMQPYSYAASPLTTPAPTDSHDRVIPGAPAPNVRLADGTFLLDACGDGFCGIWFGAPEAEARATLDEALCCLDPRFTTFIAPAEAQRVYGLPPGAYVLLRPDLHVAGWWSTAEPEAIAAGLSRALARTV